jgi:dCTP diphosphatase
MDLEVLTQRVDLFAAERDWEQFHSVRSLILALVGEVGELAEVVQWTSDAEMTAFLEAPENKGRLGEEIADVLLYALRLASVAKISPVDALEAKLLINDQKYPIDKSKGSSAKCDRL